MHKADTSVREDCRLKTVNYFLCEKTESRKCSFWWVRGHSVSSLSKHMFRIMALSNSAHNPPYCSFFTETWLRIAKMTRIYNCTPSVFSQSMLFCVEWFLSILKWNFHRRWEIPTCTFQQFRVTSAVSILAMEKLTWYFSECLESFDTCFDFFFEILFSQGKITRYLTEISMTQKDTLFLS